ncbi:MAG: ATP-binding protein [Candidatus Hydrothermarchaeaceae archaeon]
MKQKYLDKTFARSMTFGYVFALGLLSVLSIAAYLVLVEAIKAQETHAAVVNVAGRQRMLSQRIEVFSLLLAGGEDQAELEEFRLELLDAVSLMEKSHNGLINGDPSMNLPGDPSPRVRAMYFDPPMSLDSGVRKYLSEAKALADVPDAELAQENLHLQYVINAARDELLKDLDAVVKQYEIEAEEDNARLQRLEALVLGVTLTVLLMVAWFIFRPMVRRIQRDITERGEAERRLQEYTRQLESSNRMKDLFTDILRHDLMNPASMIKNAAELMQEDRGGEELDIIRSSAERIIEITTVASQLGKLKGVEHLDTQKMDLGEVLRSVVDDYSKALSEKKQEVVFDAEGEFEADANPLVEQVFANLVSNAMKYSPEQTTITLDVVDEDASWKVMVMDQCGGIRDEDKDRIFGRYERVKKAGVKGTGLGLAIAKRIVELHDGEIWVEGDPEGRGCIFNVRLPKKAGEQHEST